MRTLQRSHPSAVPAFAEGHPFVEELVSTGKASGTDGRQVDIHSAVNFQYADALHKLVLKNKPTHVLEVGMAFGVSTLAVLTALERVGNGSLISIDPYQKDFHGAGIENVRRSGLAPRHTLIEEPDYFALPALLKKGHVLDLAYIDGMHTFDYVLLDGFFVDKLLRVGGIVGFNDCGFRSVHRYLSFFVKHRRYEEIDVGLPPNYQARNPLFSLARRVTGRSGADRYFRKLDNWEPPHNYYRIF